MKLFETILTALTLIAVLSTSSQGSMEEVAEESGKVRPTLPIAQNNGLTSCRPVQEGDFECVKALSPFCNASFKGSYFEQWFIGLVLRKASTPYPALIFFDKDETPQALVSFEALLPLSCGSELTDTTDILTFFIERGVVRFKSQGGGPISYKQEDLEQVENKGVGYMRPLFFDRTSQEIRTEVIRVSTDIFKTFSSQGLRLPNQGGYPTILMGLVGTQAEDADLRKAYLACGFTSTYKKGFNVFDGEPKMVVYVEFDSLGTKSAPRFYQNGMDLH